MKKNKKEKFLPFALPLIGKEEISEVTDTLRSGWLTTGPKTRRFEEDFKKYVKAKHAVAVNSCTAALHLALGAIGIKAGDEVLVPTMTFTATAEVVTYFNAKPVFIDCDPDTLLMDTDKIEEKITKKTKAIIPVHYGGQSCDIDKILKIAKKHKLKVIWDAAHALPTTYKRKNIAQFPDITCFSFYVTKTIATGEGGMAVTDNENYAKWMRVASLHGMSRDAWKRYQKGGSWYYEVVMPGFKYNLTDIASAIGIRQLKKAGIFMKRRSKIARQFSAAFKGLAAIKSLAVRPYGTHAWHLYVIKIDPKKLKIDRDRFIEELRVRNIGTGVHFTPLHLHPYWQKTYHLKPGDFPGAMAAYKQIISLPIYPKMTDKDVSRVIGAVKSIVINNLNN
jgi:perosamine synthetase